MRMFNHHFVSKLQLSILLNLVRHLLALEQVNFRELRSKRHTSLEQIAILFCSVAIQSTYSRTA
jgi:hypothetical protein